jgi:hypothetical protein
LRDLSKTKLKYFARNGTALELTMTDAQKVAEGLSEAQRRAVLSATWSDGNGVWHLPGWYCRADRRVRYNLARAGICGDYLRPSNRLKPLGLEVRAILQEKAGG